MRVDLYTKAVLTLIAGCLLMLLFKPIFVPQVATAQQEANTEETQKVYVVGGQLTVNGTVDVEEVHTPLKVSGSVEISSDHKYRDYEDVLNVRVVNPW